jgi:peroxiredoxin
MQRDEQGQLFPLGTLLPDFSLLGTDGRSVSSSDYFSNASFYLVVFSCNHCPYVKGSDAMLNETITAYTAKGLKAAVISSNDALQYPEDSFEKMKEKAEGMPCPYLFDETQQVAKMFDAQCTPECYLFNRERALVFHGAVNDSPRDPSQAKTNYLANAMDQLLKGVNPSPGFVHSIGCSIKWKR